jgi:hypothetical protein
MVTPGPDKSRFLPHSGSGRSIEPGVVASARQTVDVSFRFDSLLPWVLRAAWVAVLVLGGNAIESASGDRSGNVTDVAIWGAGGIWLVGVAAMAIPAVVSLTATRVVVPLSIPAAGVAWAAGAPSVDGALAVGVASIATVVAFSATIGRVFVQASAYGEEDRHLLRPPAAYLFAVVVTWAVWAASVLSGPLALATGGWLLGGLLSGFAVAVGVWAWTRWHRLSRRWLVVVPVGLVIHDQLVLAETLMLRRQEIASVRLAPGDTEAADLTGPAAGHAVEISTVEPVTAFFAATPKQPRGTAIHLTACLVSPTRPGLALSAAADRRLPVG